MATANWAKYVAAIIVAWVILSIAFYYPAKIFIYSAAGWLFLIPAVFLIYLAYGLWAYRQDMKHMIIVKTKPTEAVNSLAREAEERKKEKILYEELRIM